MSRNPDEVPRHFPVHMWLGVALVAIFWPLNWLLPGLRTHLLFGPLWLGFVLTVDGVVLRRRGTSLLRRSPRLFIGLFAMSAPAWWLFETLNSRTQNWMYHGSEDFSPLVYGLLATISFSTVMPAVFEAAELVRSLRWTERFRSGPPIRTSHRLRLVLLFVGGLFLALVLLYPGFFYPLVWGSVVLLLEPMNQWLGRPSLFDRLRTGDWTQVVSLAAGTLLCGFFWELWNYWSYPKWSYDTPGAEFFYVFEMPLLGYLGYLPFGLELYALASLMAGRRLRLNL